MAEASPAPSAPYAATRSVPLEVVTVPGEAGTGKTAKYKAPEQNQLSKGLQFAPFAKNATDSAIILLIGFGITSVATVDQYVKGEYYLWWDSFAPGLYSICVGFFWMIVHFFGNYTKEDKSADASTRYWHPAIRKTLSIFQLHLVRFFLLFAGSVYCFFSYHTMLCGATMIFAAVLYLIAAIRGERWRPITGLK
eukprot:GEZU01004468.1.p1 GENE.GEZU01004468.1~~GEZU01004468.1.p1  ORF type:complete len:194 (-),score=27.93 GEZU01004468.1:201-782(-)